MLTTICPALWLGTQDCGNDQRHQGKLHHYIIHHNFSTDLQAPHPQESATLAPAAPVAENATTPALENAESAMPDAPASAVVNPTAEEASAPNADPSVVKPALEEGSQKAAEAASAVDAKAPVTVEERKVGGKDEIVKDVKAAKEVKKDKSKKREKKV